MTRLPAAVAPRCRCRDRRRRSADHPERGRRGSAGRRDRPPRRQAGDRVGPRAQCGLVSRARRDGAAGTRRQAADRARVDIEGRSRRVVRFEVLLAEPGLYQGYVEAAGKDDLPFDDRRYLAFDARRTDRVLLVDGQPGPSVFGNETYYLETALRLRLPGDESTRSPTAYEPVRQPWTGGRLRCRSWAASASSRYAMSNGSPPATPMSSRISSPRGAA